MVFPFPSNQTNCDHQKQLPKTRNTTPFGSQEWQIWKMQIFHTTEAGYSAALTNAAF